MKTNFSIRPLNVRLKEHITAHCLSCVLALIMMRRIEIDLCRQHCHLSIADTSKALWGACVMPLFTLGKTGEVLFANTTAVTDVYSIDDRAGELDSDKAWTDRAVTNWLQKNCERQDPLSSIMRSRGLTPLSAYNTLDAINKRLKIRLNKQTYLGRLGMAAEEALKKAKMQSIPLHK